MTDDKATRLFDGDPFDPEHIDLTERQEKKATETAEETKYKALARRREAYVRVFVTGNSAQEDRDIVMNDMTRFCRGDASTFDMNERVHCLLEGRREWYQRVQDHVQLTQDALWVKYNSNQNEG